MKSLNFALLLTLTLPLALSGCGGIPSPFNDNPTNTSFDTSHPAVYSDILAAENAALSQDPMGIKQGEFVHTTQTYIFDGSVSELVAETTKTITNRYAQADDIMLTIAQTQVTYSGGHPTSVSTEAPACVPTDNNGCGGPEPSPTPDPTAPTPTPTPMPLEYYNFSQAAALQDPPAAVKSSSDCGGLSTCKIHVTTLSWDQIDRNENPSGDRLHVVLQISPDVPYLSGILNQCITGLLPVDGGMHVLAQECDTVVDFHFGHD